MTIALNSGAYLSSAVRERPLESSSHNLLPSAEERFDEPTKSKFPIDGALVLLHSDVSTNIADLHQTEIPLIRYRFSPRIRDLRDLLEVDILERGFPLRK